MEDRPLTPYEKYGRWGKKHWSALILLVSAFACAAWFGKNEDALIRQLSGAYFGYSLAAGMMLWGLIHWEEGRIKGRGPYYYRDQNPKMFGFLMVFKIVLPSLCGLAVGVFYPGFYTPA